MEGLNRSEADPGARREDVAGARFGTWDLDLSTRAFEGSATARSLFGVSEGPTIGYEALVSHVDPDDRVAVIQALEQSAATGADLDIQYRVRRDGGAHWLRARGGVVGRRRRRRLSGVVFDID